MMLLLLMSVHLDLGSCLDQSVDGIQREIEGGLQM